MWARHTEEILKPLGEEVGGSEGETETQPADVPFPELPAPDLSAGEVLARLRTGDEYEGEEQYEDTRGNDGD